mmetsp:Transcript_47384/g.106581  ORF Transcript_47384/g.106581 Transcript_47384/m.106581 type:complete len:319 (-) Transcript_47384:177-1133(-)
MGLFQHGEGNSHIACKGLTTFVELHDATPCVMLAVPVDLFRGGLVEAQPERRLALPHFTCHVVTAAELIGETLAVGIEHKATDSTQSLCRKELDFGIRIIRLYQASWVHLDPLQVDALGTNGLTHLDAITSAVLAVSGGEMHQVGPVLCKEGVLCEIGAKPASCQDDRPMFLELHTALLVRQAHAVPLAVHQQPRGARLRNDASLVRPLCDLLHHLDQRVCDGHPWEALLATVGAWSRVAAKACHQRQVQVEFLHQPVHIIAAVSTQNLHHIGFLGASLQGVGSEQLDGVGNALGLLGLRVCAVDTACGLGGVATAER